MDAKHNNMFSFVEEVLLRLARELPHESFETASEILLRELQYSHIQNTVYTPQSAFDEVQKKIVRRLDTLLASTTQHEIRDDRQFKLLERLESLAEKTPETQRQWETLERLEESLAATDKKLESVESSLVRLEEKMAEPPSALIEQQEQSFANIAEQVEKLATEWKTIESLEAKISDFLQSASRQPADEPPGLSRIEEESRHLREEMKEQRQEVRKMFEELAAKSEEHWQQMKPDQATEKNLLDEVSSVGEGLQTLLQTQDEQLRTTEQHSQAIAEKVAKVVEEAIAKNSPQNDVGKLDLGTLETALWRIEQRLEKAGSPEGEAGNWKEDVGKIVEETIVQIVENFDKTLAEHVSAAVDDRLGRLSQEIENRFEASGIAQLRDEVAGVTERSREFDDKALEEYFDARMEKMEQRLSGWIRDEMEKDRSKDRELLDLLIHRTQNTLEQLERKVTPLSGPSPTGKPPVQTKLVASCPHCGREATAPASYQGKRVICRHCSKGFVFP